mgnify:CR=1 FL=1
MLTIDADADDEEAAALDEGPEAWMGMAMDEAAGDDSFIFSTRL